MASVVINPGTVTHTLGPYSCGWNQDTFVYTDLDNTFFRSLSAAGGPELIRCTSLNSPMTYIGYTKLREYFKYMQTQLGNSFGVLLYTTAMPVPLPSSPASSILASIQTASGYGPADHANLYQDWVNYGINVTHWEFENEAENMTFGLGSAPWYDPATWGAVGAQYRAHDWCNIRHREIVASYTSRITALGKTTKIVGCEVAGFNNNAGYQYLKGFLNGQIFSGSAANPNIPPSNIPYINTLAGHSYGGGLFGSDVQGAINSYFYDAGGNEAAFLAEGGKARIRTPLRLLRSYLDANGGSNVKLGISEGGGLTPGSVNALTDIAQAISFCQVAGVYGLDYLLVWSMNRSSPQELMILRTDDGVNPTSEAGYQPGRRYYAFRDFWGKYMKTYKRQLQVTVSGSVDTPASANNNPVPSIQGVAGLNSDGSKLGIMLVNLDLSNTRQADVFWSSAAQGLITGVSAPNPASHAPLPTIAPFGNGATSFTTLMPPGSSILYEIPQAPGQPPPTGDPHIGNWTTAVQINAGGIAPPPPLDQHLGNWTTATQITVRTSSRIGAGHNTGIARTIGGLRIPGLGGGGG